MSVATAFVSIGSFPFCVTSSNPGGSTSGFGPARYVSGLSRAQVMQFYWNLETFALTFTGSYTFTDGPDTHSGTSNASFTVSPLGFTGDLATVDQFGVNDNVVMPGSGGFVSSGAVLITPRERVCAPSGGSQTPPWLNMVCWSSAGSSYATFDIEFGVEEDSSDPTLYAIRYGIVAKFPIGGSGPSFFQDINFTHIQPASSSGIIASGTFTVGGIAFPWWAVWSYVSSYSLSASSVGLSATSSDFTY